MICCLNVASLTYNIDVSFSKSKWVILVFTYSFDFVFHSNIEDKEQVLELDQLQAKTESAYASLHEKTKPTKSRSGKSKRRSTAAASVEKYTPYQLPTPPVMYSDTASAAAAAAAGEYSQHRAAAAYGQYTACEVPVPAAQYATVPYQEGIDRYNAMYSAAGYATGYQPNVYADGAYGYGNSFAYSSAEAYAHCMNERLQYRGHYGDERYYTSDPRYFAWSAHDSSRSVLSHGLTSDSSESSRKSSHVQSETTPVGSCNPSTEQPGQPELLLQQCGHSQQSDASPSHSHLASRSQMSERNSYHSQSPVQTGSPPIASDISPHSYRNHRQRDGGHESSTSSTAATSVAPHAKFDSLVQATQHMVKEEQHCKKSPQRVGSDANVVQSSDSGFGQGSPAGREQACRQASPAQGDVICGRTQQLTNTPNSQHNMEATEASDSSIRSGDYTTTTQLTEMRRASVAGYSTANHTGHGSPSYPVNLSASTTRSDHLSPEHTGADIPDRPVEAADGLTTAAHYGSKDPCYYTEGSGKGYFSSFSFADSSSAISGLRRGSGKEHAGFTHTNSAISDRTTAMSWYGNSTHHHKELPNGYVY